MRKLLIVVSLGPGMASKWTRLLYAWPAADYGYSTSAQTEEMVAGISDITNLTSKSGWKTYTHVSLLRGKPPRQTQSRNTL